MGVNNHKSTDGKVSREICQALERMIRDIETEPGLIIEGEPQPVEGENTLREIRSWLFGKRRENGHRHTTPDK